MTGWPKVELSAGPSPYIDRVVDDLPYITESKRPVAYGLVDGIPWSLTSFRIEEPRRRRAAEGRTLEFVLGRGGAYGGGGHAARIPKSHRINVSSCFFGGAPNVSAHVGVADDSVHRIAVVLDDEREAEVDLFDTPEGFPRAFVLFAPTGDPGEIRAFDGSGEVVDPWKIALRPQLPRSTNAFGTSWHPE